MNDKIKLIIEIPKDYYEALAKTEEIISSQRSGKTLMSVIYSAVANGTPLDEKEPTYEEVIEYCKKRHLDLVTHAFMHTLLNGGDK